ncbi:hypothetical protein [Aciditerrimonas ferrireducens]|uniref:hypothetical protein n=1 Tax=Aciditerrimonas ferrireducens TaxID=667306 RepID=UPI0035E3BDC9
MHHEGDLGDLAARGSGPGVPVGRAEGRVLERGVAHEVAGGVEGTEVEGPGRRPSGGKLRDGELVDGPAAPAAMTG